MLKLIDEPDRGQEDIGYIVEEFVDYFLIVAGGISFINEVVEQLPDKERYILHFQFIKQMVDHLSFYPNSYLYIQNITSYTRLEFLYPCIKDFQ